MNEKTRKSPKIKVGRRPLGEDKRTHNITLRFNPKELQELNDIAATYEIDLSRTGQLGPFLRKLIFLKGAKGNFDSVAMGRGKTKTMPNDLDKISYQVHKIGININQVTQAIHKKKRRYADAETNTELRTLHGLLENVYDSINGISK